MQNNLCKFEYLLGKHCATTLARIKPANLFSLDLQLLPKLYEMQDSLNTLGTYFEVLRICNSKARIFIYNLDQLSSLLFQKETKEFLKGYGYDYNNVDEAIRQLKDKYDFDCFPHEVGVFLGYDLEDVKGFINDPQAHIICGHWKVYCNPKEKEKLFERYRCCTRNVCNRLNEGQTLGEIFNMA
ncbi:MAG TPA: DUF3793 family protein [Clostridia bacterium]|jgi:hypothetical protein|nr:DUF3793 family protein [Clostridia bacterium]